jgi:hypothetical protein
LLLVVLSLLGVLWKRRGLNALVAKWFLRK